MKATGFPLIPLTTAVKIMESALKFGKSWPKTEFAGYGSKKGKGSATSGAFANRLAALRDYGLIVTTKDTVTATELAERLIRPVSDKERSNAYIAAFMNADVFRKLFEELAHDEDLPLDKVKEVAVLRLGISRDPRTQSSFSHSFTLSGAIAGLVTQKDATTVVLHGPATAPPGGTNQERVDGGEELMHEDEPSGVSLELLQRKNIGGRAANTQGVDHAGKNWRLTVSFTSTLTVKSETRKQIRELIAKADEVADTFYELEESQEG